MAAPRRSRLLAEIEQTAARLEGASPALEALAPAVRDAAAHARRATEWMLATPEINDRFAGSTPYLRLWAHTLGAHYLAKGALADPSDARLALAAFHCRQIAPQCAALAAAATEGAGTLYAVPAERLSA